MWNNGKKIAVAFGFDFDAETLWYGMGMKTPTPTSRGQYGAYVGMPRVLELCDKYKIKATIFVPGWTAEKYPDIVKEAFDKGHEIAHHGWLHENPNEMPAQQEEEEFDRGVNVFKSITSQIPKGYRSPAFDLGPNTLNLLKKHNYVYDTSMMAHEYPYIAKDSKGNDTGIVELPVSWELDDAPHFLFNYFPVYLSSLSNPSKVFEIWKDEFDYLYEKESFFCLTMHPQIIARPHRIKLLEKLIQYMMGFPGVWFATHLEAAQDYLAQQKAER
jgi:peptidoglycan/xylan/chitin deacetylase (PgdA/CDA1 family)